MQRAFDWAFGIVSLLIGLGVGGWIAYNYLVEMQPEAEGRNPILPLLLTAVGIYVGIRRIRRALKPTGG